MKKLSKVMLVDDSAGTNLMNKYILEKLDACHDIIIANNGQEALTYFEENLQDLPELIFLDIKMPVMDGFEFLDAIDPHKNKLGDTVVIVMLSSSMSPKDIARSKTYNYIQDFLSKPLTLEKAKNLLLKHYG